MNKKDKKFDFTAIVYPFYKCNAIRVELYRIEDFVKYIEKHRPKGKVDVKSDKVVRGNEDIEEWRRLE